MSRAAQRPTTLKFYCATQAASRLFKDDGVIPNHPKWPLFIYKSAVRLPGALDPAAVFEDLFRANGWGKSWRDSIYKYAHYHSRIHEVLGIARGSCTVQFGGLEDALSTSRRETWLHQSGPYARGAAERSR